MDKDLSILKGVFGMHHYSASFTHTIWSIQFYFVWFTYCW